MRHLARSRGQAPTQWNPWAGSCFYYGTQGPQATYEAEAYLLPCQLIYTPAWGILMRLNTLDMQTLATKDKTINLGTNLLLNRSAQY